MVLPFRHRAESAPLLLNGDQCESLLHDALARWRGVQMVDPLWVADARSRRGGAGSIEDGLAIARERRAGRVVLGEVWQFKDTIYVRGLLYDAAGQRLVREQSVRIAPDLSDAQARFQELADSLLIGGGLAAGAPPRGGAGCRSPPGAPFRTVRGAAALGSRFGQGQAEAGARYRSDLWHRAAWLAQVLAWAGDEAKSWRELCRGRARLGRQPGPARSRVGEAMLALAESGFPDACDEVPGADRAGLAGLRCLVRAGRLPGQGSAGGARLQRVVGLAFPRELSSRGECLPASAGDRAFGPPGLSGRGFHRLPELLYTEPNHIRQGFALHAGYGSLRRIPLDVPRHARVRSPAASRRVAPNRERFLRQ